MLEGDSKSHLKYPWQQELLDAFLEFHAELLPSKIKAAEGVISARLLDLRPHDCEEHLALQDALRSLRTLSPRKDTCKEELSKQEIA